MAPKTATLKSAAMARVPMEPLPEHMIEAMTGEQLVIDLAALTGRTVEEVRQDRVQSTLVAPFMSGGAPKGRLDLQRQAQGESFVRPATETADPPTGDSEPALGMPCRLGSLPCPMFRMS